MHSDHVWLRYLRIEKVWGVDPFGPNDWSSFQLGIRVLDGAIVKKCGFRLICKSLEDDLEALYQEEKLQDPGLIYKIFDKETTTEEESHLAHKVSLSPFPLRDCGGCVCLIWVHYVLYNAKTANASKQNKLIYCDFAPVCDSCGDSMKTMKSQRKTLYLLTEKTRSCLAALVTL